MILLTVIITTFFPTLLFYILFPKVGFHIHSKYLKISFAWFLGVVMLTFSAFFLSIIYSLFLTHVLFKAVMTVDLIILSILLIFYKDLADLFIRLMIRYKNRKLIKWKDCLFLAFFLTFSISLFSPQVAMQDGKIYGSPIYWDLHWHVPIIQTFVFGDNFPPINESLSGVPMTYHFFGDLVFAVYESIGLNLADSINFVSIIFFFFLLVAIVGFAEELFPSKNAGFLAAILTLFSSGLHFVNYFNKANGQNIYEIIGNILNNTSHPWYASFNIMFNLFYFIEERHLIISVIYLLFCLWCIYKRDKLPNKTLVFVGIFIGAFFLWHVYATIIIFMVLLFIFIFDSKKKKTLILLALSGLIIFGHYVVLKNIASSEWFLKDTSQYPKLNFSFAGGTIEDRVEYYARGYGLLIFLAPISIIFLLINYRKLGLIYASIITTTFIFVNSIQLTEHGGVGENHKFIVPMNVIIHIVSAYIIYIGFFKKRNLFIKFLGVIVVVLVTLSGFIENMPFINSKPTELFGEYPSSFTRAIQANSEPKSVFLGGDQKEIHLAGRITFTGDIAGPNVSIDKVKREEIINTIYSSANKADFCSQNKKYGIDYIQYDPRMIYITLDSANSFTTTNENNQQVTFVNIKQSCN